MSDQLKQLEAALGSLRPQPADLDREQILYESGRAAGLAERRTATSVGQRWLVAATAALLVLSLTTTALWLRERNTQPVVVEQLPREDGPRKDTAEPGEVEAPAFAMELRPTGEYFALRQLVLEQGVDALPQAKFDNDNSRRPAPSLRDVMEGI